MPWPKPVELLAQCPVWDGLDSGTLVVACSGGRDSVALALAAHELLPDPRFCERFSTPPILVLWHLDHGLRPDSPQDAEFVQGLAGQLGIRCIAERAELAQELARLGGNMEALARHERYLRLSQLLKYQVERAAHAVTAHHLGDQAETILHHLIRGTRLAGLRGIAPVLDEWIFRPWLALQPEEIQTYLDSRDVGYRSDPSNCDLTLTRNRLRHKIIPALCEINPAAREHIARLAGMARETYALQKATARPAEVELVGSARWTRWLPLYADVMATYAVYYASQGWWNAQHLVDFIVEHAAGLGIVDARESSDLEPWAVDPQGTLHVAWLRYELPCAGMLVFRALGVEPDTPPMTRLATGMNQVGSTIEANFCATQDDTAQEWRSRMLKPWERISSCDDCLPEIIRQTLDAAEWRCYLPDGVALPLSLRTWREGDRIELTAGGTKRLGDIFTDAKIPTCFRSAWAVLVDAHDKALWVPALADSAAMRITPARPARWLVTIRSTG